MSDSIVLNHYNDLTDTVTVVDLSTIIIIDTSKLNLGKVTSFCNNKEVLLIHKGQNKKSRPLKKKMTYMNLSRG